MDQIVLPMLDKLAKQYHPEATPLIPDLISFTPGFWTIQRLVREDYALTLAQANQGISIEKEKSEIDLNFERREWAQKRMEEVIMHLANAWEPVQMGQGRSWKPKILWRQFFLPLFIRDGN